ncbi:MAG: hypothetical protein ABI323_13555 [Solirubrobacteraceae bacterium]
MQSASLLVGAAMQALSTLILQSDQIQFIGHEPSGVEQYRHAFSKNTSRPQ